MPFLDELQAALGPDYVHSRLPERMAYAYDATGEKHPPDAVALPASAEQVLAVLRIARKHGVPVVARGAGTNLSGGTVPVQGGLVLNLLRMNRILNIDVAGRRAEVEPGVVNGRLNDALRLLGFHYAPDPSSMKISTIGGNIAENAGGPNCLKYGVTASHVLGLQLATSDGELLDLTEADAYDLQGLVVGSEGTLGIVTRATPKVRLEKRVTWHDPCSLKHGMNVWAAPRQLIRAIPGVEYVEAADADVCCGGAGSFMPELIEMAYCAG